MANSEGHGINRDRWLVSYADFMTMLLAFFVVMYSISSVNEGKYRVVSDSLNNAFGRHHRQSGSERIPLVSPSQVVLPMGQSASSEAVTVPLRAVEPSPVELAAGDSGPEQDQNDRFNQEVLDKAEAEIDAIGKDVEENVADLIDNDLINVKRNKFWLEVEVKSSLLFDSGQSDLLAAAEPVILKLAGILAKLPNQVHVEGFTDNRPINNTVFPSNWELSAARAAAVVRIFERNGVDPARLAAIGYGQYKPIATNATAAGQATNRRVVLVVMASLKGQEGDRLYEFELLKGRAAEATAG